MRRERIMKASCALLIVLLGALSCLVVGAARGPVQGTPPGIQRWIEAGNDREKVRAVMRALQVHPRMAEPSLAVREQVDFLLTPALLVQEAISEDVVLTYPEE